jgi:cell division protein FtsI (penicillin-binding protein 3)
VTAPSRRPPVRSTKRTKPKAPAKPKSRIRPLRPRPPAQRLVALLAVMGLGLGGILFRLVVLQVGDAQAYQDMAIGQRLKTVKLSAERGTILDRNGRALAMSLPAKAVFADPVVVENPSTEARTIAAILGLPRREVERQLQPATRPDGKPLRFVYLLRGVDIQTARRLEAKHLAGIGFVDESRRYYPGDDLASQVLGFVGTDRTGLAGLEQQYQSVLAGRPGERIFEVGNHGTFIPQATNEATAPAPGSDLMLTIDQDIQYRAETALARAVKSNHAKGGTVIVMDPRTGDILAMANAPTFDPSHFGDYRSSRWLNGAVARVYEPGSVNKVITASAAIEEHAVSLTERFTVPDSYQLYDKLFHDAHPHPTETMTLGDILAYSSNIGTIQVAARLGKDRFAEYLDRFGFGHRTGLGFPGESAGILAPPDAWWGTSMGTIPIGQGIAVTPLQMASVYATIANGGVWVQPRLVKATVGPTGRQTPAAASRTRRVVSEATARTVMRMLAYAVEVGTGTEGQVDGYWVAGKTGTARKPLPHALGYSDKYVASFIGFLPASNPSLVVAAILDEPDTVFGGVASAPLFAEVAHAAVARLRIPPAAKPALPAHAIPTG